MMVCSVSEQDAVDTIDAFGRSLQQPAELSPLAAMVWVARQIGQWHHDNPSMSKALDESRVASSNGHLVESLRLLDTCQELQEMVLIDIGGMSPEEFLAAVAGATAHLHRTWRADGYPHNWRPIVVNTELRLAGVSESSRVAIYQELERIT